MWSSCTLGQSNKLEVLQNFAACIVLRPQMYTSATTMRNEQGWPTLLSRRILAETLIVHCCLSGTTLNYFSSLFQPTSSVHSHMTRSASAKRFQLPQVRTKLGRKSFAFRGAYRWNSLPPNLKNMSHSTSFVSAARVYTLSYKL